MYSRINEVGNSNAFYFALSYEGSLIQKIVVEFFDPKNASWSPIIFKLQPNISNGLGIYTFDGPSGSNIKLRCKMGMTFT